MKPGATESLHWWAHMDLLIRALGIKIDLVTRPLTPQNSFLVLMDFATVYVTADFNVPCVQRVPPTLLVMLTLQYLLDFVFGPFNS